MNDVVAGSTINILLSCWVTFLSCCGIFGSDSIANCLDASTHSLAPEVIDTAALLVMAESFFG